MKIRKWENRELCVISHIRCDLCGREFDIEDYEGGTITIEFEYPSRFDTFTDLGVDFADNIDVCDNCFESKLKVLDDILDKRWKEVEEEIRHGSD